jgi:pimeloyl-ACP methyl ester carboxylesterase
MRIRHRVVMVGVVVWAGLCGVVSAEDCDSITIRKHYMDVAGGQLHYVTSGEGEPLLLLHQAPLSHAEYLDAIPLLAEHFHVIAWDAPGHGGSYIPPREYEIPDYMAVLDEFITKLGHQKVHIAGIHSGAAFARQYAALYPEKTGKIVLAGSAEMPPNPKTELTEAKEFLSQPYSRELQLTADGSFLPSAWQRYVTLSADGTPLDVVLKPFIIGLDARTKPYDLHLAVFRFEDWKSRSEIKSPTLLLYAEGDFFVNQEGMGYTQTLIPDCELYPTIKGAGAFLALEKPEEFAAAVTQFLQKP